MSLQNSLHFRDGEDLCSHPSPSLKTLPGVSSSRERHLTASPPPLVAAASEQNPDRVAPYLNKFSCSLLYQSQWMWNAPRSSLQTGGEVFVSTLLSPKIMLQADQATATAASPGPPTGAAVQCALCVAVCSTVTSR